MCLALFDKNGNENLRPIRKWVAVKFVTCWSWRALFMSFNGEIWLGWFCFQSEKHGEKKRTTWRTRKGHRSTKLHSK